MAATRTVCPITRTQFTTTAKPLAINVGGTTIAASPKQFSTGSLGYFANGKVTLMVDGVACVFQVSCNVTLVGSKELPEATQPAASPATLSLAS